MLTIANRTPTSKFKTTRPMPGLVNTDRIGIRCEYDKPEPGSPTVALGPLRPPTFNVAPGLPIDVDSPDLLAFK